jgi:hypothetical protein
MAVGGAPSSANVDDVIKYKVKNLMGRALVIIN